MHTWNSTHQGGRNGQLPGACWPVSLAQGMSSRVSEEPGLKKQDRGAGDIFQRTELSSQHPCQVTPALRNPTPSSGTMGFCTYVAYIYSDTHIYINKNKSLKNDKVGID